MVEPISGIAQSSLDKLQALYRDSSESVRCHSFDYETAAQAFHTYVDFVNQTAPEKGLLLDVGCGSGWSSYLFSEQGYIATGVDLNASAFEPPSHPRLSLLEGSALELPFEDATFDVVSTDQMLEHVPDPQKALLEMLRVLKPEGVLCIVGPNNLSLGVSLKTITLYVWQNRPVHKIFIRVPGMPKHPNGNTLPEAILILFLNGFRIVQKSISKSAAFTMREPDLVPPFHGDNDACYLCNPIDLSKFLKSHQCSILQNGKYGRSPLTALFAGGTWIAARKAEV